MNQALVRASVGIGFAGRAEMPLNSAALVPTATSKTSADAAIDIRVICISFILSFYAKNQFLNNAA
jgi:hypothetical protein